MACAQYIESDIGRKKIVTSASRPTGASRYAGQVIYETDTLRTLEYDGTDWTIMSEPSQVQAGSIFSGITGGSVTESATYHRSDGYCDFDARLVFGASPSTISGLAYNLPVNAPASTPAGVASGILDDVGVQAYPIIPVWNPSSIALWGTDASVTAARISGVSSSSPFSFGAGDLIRIAGRFRMASRYS